MKRTKSGSGWPPPAVQVSLTDCPARAKACPLADRSESPSTLTSRAGGLEGPERDQGQKREKDEKESRRKSQEQNQKPKQKHRDRTNKQKVTDKTTK